jgi:hypothetical protein
LSESGEFRDEQRDIAELVTVLAGNKGNAPNSYEFGYGSELSRMA